MGVFATRSPFRPNPLGLSCVRLDHVEVDRQEGPVIFVKGADLMDGTPIYDIKPYVAYADAGRAAALWIRRRGSLCMWRCLTSWPSVCLRICARC